MNLCFGAFVSCWISRQFQWSLVNSNNGQKICNENSRIKIHKNIAFGARKIFLIVRGSRLFADQRKFHKKNFSCFFFAAPCALYLPGRIVFSSTIERYTKRMISSAVVCKITVCGNISTITHRWTLETHRERGTVCLSPPSTASVLQLETNEKKRGKKY